MKRCMMASVDGFEGKIESEIERNEVQRKKEIAKFQYVSWAMLI